MDQVLKSAKVESVFKEIKNRNMTSHSDEWKNANPFCVKEERNVLKISLCFFALTLKNHVHYWVCQYLCSVKQVICYTFLVSCL